MLSLGLLYIEFTDAVKEGDDERILRVWKYLLLLFKASKHKNYAIEAFSLLQQYHFSLPSWLAEQLKWSRFINVYGLPGHNVSCDLYLEHLNRLVKTAVDGLGANKSEKAILRVGKTVGTLVESLENLDNENHVPSVSGAHSKRPSDKDKLKVLEQLMQMDPFQPKDGRKHNSFKNMRTNLIRTLDKDKLMDWLVQQFGDKVLGM